ncbi:MAG: DUF4375 domain-containing protein [Fluviicola sp.]|nr:DUF4375 domain-containing protein [Fluviicola sp.]
MIKRKISKELIGKERGLVWNAYVDLVCMEEYEDLTEIQQVGKALFWYENEVMNGGHMQFLLNRGIEELELTIKALKFVYHNEFIKLLEDAKLIYSELDFSQIVDKESYIEMALEDHFDQCDEKFYQINPSLYALQLGLLLDYQQEFIELI